MPYYPAEISGLVRRLVDLSREYGTGSDYVLGGGGNTSVKEGDFLVVKASGTELGTIDEDGFVLVSRARLDRIWSRSYSADVGEREREALADLMAARLVEGDSRRPSVETLVHALFPQRFVVHTHPALVNGLTCSAENMGAALRLFGPKLVWIPVVDPGYTLAGKVRAAVENHSKKQGELPQVVWLQNHGIFVAANSEDEIRELYRGVFDQLGAVLRERPVQGTQEFPAAESGDLLARVQQAIPGCVSVMFSNTDIDAGVASRQAFAELELSPTPDHIVYSGHRPLWVSEESSLEQDIREFLESEGYPPRIIAVRGRGVIAAHEIARRLDLARRLFEDGVRIAVYARSFGGIRFMPQANIDFIRSWEVEKFRAAKLG